MSRNDYLWRVRCPETGDLVGDCGCFYCADEYDIDFDDMDIDLDDWSEEWMDDDGIE